MYKNHIASFNDFIHSIPDIIADIPPCRFQSHTIIIKEILFDKPYEIFGDNFRKIKYQDCLESMSSYRCKATVIVDVDGQTEKIPLGMVPVMVGSVLCHNEEKNLDDGYSYIQPSVFDLEKKNYTDTKNNNGVFHELEKKFTSIFRESPTHPTIIEPSGGYFIINGQEKVIRWLITPKRHVPLLIYRDSLKKKSKLFTAKAVHFRSVRNERGYVFFFHLCNDKNVYLRMIIKKREYMVPVILILKGLKDCTDEEIINNLGKDGRFLLDAKIINRTKALNELSSIFHSLQISIIDQILPHLNTHSDKYDCIILCLKKLLYCNKFDDLDSTANQEIIGPRQILSILFYDKLTETLATIKRVFESSTEINSTTEKTNSEESAEKNNSNKKADSDSNEKNIDDSTSSESSEEFFDQKNYSNLEIDQTEEKTKSTQKFNLRKSTKKKNCSRSDILKKLKFNLCQRFEHFLSTGNLTMTNTTDLLQSTGLSITAERINLYRFISHFESVNRGAFFAQLKTTGVRLLRPESYGFLCPVHTPDGSPCGLILHMASGAMISRDEHIDINTCVLSIVQDSANYSSNSNHTTFKSLIKDGKVIGTVDESYIDFLRSYRIKNNLRIELIERPEGIYIFTQAGRLMRPVLTFKEEKIIWIGAMEQVDSVVLNGENNSEYREDITHENKKIEIHKSIREKNKISENSDFSILKQEDVSCSNIAVIYKEVSPHLLFSYVAGSIPFSEYNQSPRNMYQCQMVKQAMAYNTISNLNGKTRCDNKSFNLSYLQKPLITTNINTLIGINVFIAVLCYTSYDMEDAMVLNKSSVDRGMFDGSIYKTKVVENKDLELPNIGDHIEQNQVLYKENGKEILYKDNESCIVHFIRITQQFAIITLRIRRSPEIGDKFCSRHGQKGVMSLKMSACDLPFNSQGMVPDLIINPHAFPSRMTIGMMMEILTSHLCIFLGKQVRCPTFFYNISNNKKSAAESNNIESRIKPVISKEENTNEMYSILSECLSQLGLNKFGNELLISGITGRPLRTLTFTGLCYYQRLRHMVSDKWQVRSIGLVDIKTRQPVKGRKRGGGVRFGEMEKSAMIAHGTSFLLQDRLMDCSDKTLFEYCTVCKTFLFVRNRVCLCGNKNLKLMECPFVLKYLLSELLGMNVFVEIEI